MSIAEVGLQNIEYGHSMAFAKLVSSKKFRLRKEAETWANKEKKKYKDQGQSDRDWETL